MKYLWRTLLCIFISVAIGKGQSSSSLQALYKQADDYLISYKNDSATLILNQIVEKLQKQHKLDSPFGIKVLLKQAEAQEKDDQNEIAIQSLLNLIEIGKKQQKWDVLANAYLSIARLHEKLSRWDSCKVNLSRAGTIIQKNKLDTIYPIYATRSSSYYRQSARIDSAIFYAQEVVRTAPGLGQMSEAAVGHLLLGMLLADSLYERAIAHFDTAGQQWQKVDDYNGYSAVLSNIANLHLKNGNFALALTFNDSCFGVIQQHKDSWQYGQVHVQRGSIYHKMHLYDSAYIYAVRGYELNLRYFANINQSKVAEIEARYNDEKKARLISEQAESLKDERNRQYWLWTILIAIGTFTFILFVFYTRLRKAKEKTDNQAVVIVATNERLKTALQQQKMLLGEVHHRVKNNLQIIISLLELQAEELEDPVLIQKLEAMSNRIFSMAAIHELMYRQDEMEFVNLEQYVLTLCEHIVYSMSVEAHPQVRLDLKETAFSMSTLIPLGIMLNELLTNSIKHTLKTTKNLIIDIRLAEKNDCFCLFYKDNGPGFPSGTIKSKEGSLGTYLLESMARQLSGAVNTYNEEGAVVELTFKAKNN